MPGSIPPVAAVPPADDGDEDKKSDSGEGPQTTRMSCKRGERDGLNDVRSLDFAFKARHHRIDAPSP